MIFLTVGSALPLDRLVRAVDTAVSQGFVTDEIFGQIGAGVYVPRHFDHVRFLTKRKYDYYVKCASAIVGHAGVGTIVSALEHGKPILVMPRLKRLGELVSEHQLSTARRFEEMGHVLVALDAHEIPQKLKELKHFIPRPRRAHTDEVGAHIGRFLEQAIKEMRKGYCSAGRRGHP